MRYLAALCLCIASFWSDPAMARMPGCTKEQEATIKTAISDAKRLVVTAAANVRDDEIFERWFGKYSPAAEEKVRATLKSIARGIRSGAVTARCARVSPQDCDVGTYAYVFRDEEYVLNICPAFFRQPFMSFLRPGTERSDNGSKAGTIVHEISHFEVIASTEDHCYSRSECSDMAIRSPARAIENADSYQYFVEDVTHFSTRDDQ